MSDRGVGISVRTDEAATAMVRTSLPPDVYTDEPVSAIVWSSK